MHDRFVQSVEISDVFGTGTETDKPEWERLPISAGGPVAELLDPTALSSSPANLAAQFPAWASKPRPSKEQSPAQDEGDDSESE